MLMAKRILVIVSLIIFGIFIAFCILEIAFRLRYGEYSLDNLLARERTLFTSGYPSQYDPQLGWVPKAGACGEENVWRTTVSIDEQSIRSNGEHQIKLNAGDRPILVVGDSFTFGDQVSDDQTWPAVLESLLQKKVINGGVFGYGVDQTYLRTRQLIDQYRPDVVIFGFHPDDINRCELSERTAVGKPYFEFRESTIHLKNVPVPKPSDKHVIGIWRRALGYSCFVHKLMMRIHPGYWIQGKDWLRSTKVHDDGEVVTRVLFEELEELGRQENIKVYFLIQYDRSLQLGRAKNVFKQYTPETAEIIDLKANLESLRMKNRGEFLKLFDSHMTYEGNAWLAGRIYEYLREGL
jgi:hypothetical protein